MAKFIGPDQLTASLKALAEFSARGRAQSLKHVLPFLALRRKGVDDRQFREYREADDLAFANEFLLVREGDRPFYDPIDRRFRIATHPHSNFSTLRKNTFDAKWDVGKRRVQRGQDKWRLSSDYLGVFKRKVLTRGKKEVLIPAAPLAVWLYRTAPLPDAEKPLDALVEKFFKDFGLSAKERGIFDTSQDLPADAFGDRPLTELEIEKVIRESGVLRDALATVPSIGADDRVLRLALDLLNTDRAGGILLVGPPGTSKSWYAVQIALHLTGGDRSRVRNIQFHKSYQYENFVQSFVPRKDGSGFWLRNQVLLRLASEAAEDLDNKYVLLIDELSRADPGRVFGEALTYMEESRRGEPFTLAYGGVASIPPNLVFIATMNAHDKSVTEIDDAFDRRLGKIRLGPDPGRLEAFLVENGMREDLRKKVVEFFQWVNNGQYELGHVYFRSVKDLDGLGRLWDCNLSFVFEKALRYKREKYDEIERKYKETVLEGGQRP